jgi:hypothetical protein
MLRRFVLIFVLLCLPFRLWAGVGLMMNAVDRPAVVVTSSHDVHPCHEADAVAPVAQGGGGLMHCGSDDCQICAVCHMPAMGFSGLLDFMPNAPRDWIASTGLHGYVAPASPLFKPPVS